VCHIDERLKISQPKASQHHMPIDLIVRADGRVGCAALEVYMRASRSS
jgi:hypothetical protein